mmetsp:Transcript_12369/g.14135  ORF Transcript_12369/g.14135 Transcript_12369/m.14135 type:complete len:271 (-) Transcript_12369:135-947(-)
MSVPNISESKCAKKAPSAIQNSARAGGQISLSIPSHDTSKPHQNDVICGRGGMANYHNGNMRFRDVVKGFEIRYNTSSRRNKPNVAHEVVNMIRYQNPPGRFLKKDKPTGTWHEIGDKMAVQKTCQVFRDIRESNVTGKVFNKETNQVFPGIRKIDVNCMTGNKLHREEDNSLKQFPRLDPCPKLVVWYSGRMDQNRKELEAPIGDLILSGVFGEKSSLDECSKELNTRKDMNGEIDPGKFIKCGDGELLEMESFDPLTDDSIIDCWAGI